MKKFKRIILVFVWIILSHTQIALAQEEQKRPEYIAVTTMHWNMDKEDFSMKEWKEVEKEFLEKVVKKNEYIVGASFFIHDFTADNTELLYVQVYNNWNDIELAADRNAELIKEAWSDDDARKSFMKKRMSFYSDHHSDEIYATMDGAMPLAEMPNKDMTLYLRQSHFAFPEDGTMKEWKELREKYISNVLSKNEHIKGYYPSMHAYGADRTDFNEAFYVESLADLDKMLGRLDELVKEAWPDEAERKEFGKKIRKYYTGVHGDYIYTYVSGLSK